MKWIPEEVQQKGINYFLEKIKAMPQEEAAAEYHEFALSARQDPFYKLHETFRKAVDEMVESAVLLKEAVAENNAVAMVSAQAEAELLLAKDTVTDALKENRKRLIGAFKENPQTPGLRELLQELMEKEKLRGTYIPGEWQGFEF